MYEATMMYDPTLLQQRMAERGYNFLMLAKRTHKPTNKTKRLDAKTVKSVVTTGVGHPESVKAIADALGLTLKDLIRPQPSSDKKRSA